MVVDAEGENPYIRVLLESIWTKNDLAEEGDIDTKLYFINVPESEVVLMNLNTLFPNI